MSSFWVIRTQFFFYFLVDTLHPKRRRTGNLKGWEFESEQEEHSLSLSQSSSPSQSDQEQTPIGKATDSSIAASLGVPLFRQPSNSQANNVSSKQKEPRSVDQSSRHDICFLGERQNQQKPENFQRQQLQYHQPPEQKPLDLVHYQFSWGIMACLFPFVHNVLTNYLFLDWSWDPRESRWSLRLRLPDDCNCKWPDFQRSLIQSCKPKNSTIKSHFLVLFPGFNLFSRSGTCNGVKGHCSRPKCFVSNGPRCSDKAMSKAHSRRAISFQAFPAGHSIPRPRIRAGLQANRNC